MPSVLLDLLGLFLVVLAAMMSPGPDMLLIARYALRAGAGAAAACIAGITLGIAVHLLLALTGLAALAAAAPDLLAWVRWAGALWLAWLGIGALRSHGGFRLDPAAAANTDDRTQGVHGPFLAGLLSNLLNVKVLLMMLALFTELLSPQAPAGIRLLGAGLVVLEVAVVWGLFARLVRTAAVVRLLERHARTLDRVFGTLLLIIAALVGFSATPWA